MRSNATPQEDKLWYQFLRNHPNSFARQKPIDNYVADFICRSKRLVIEIDGKQHYTKNGIEYDTIRTELFQSLGLSVLRFTNDEIDSSFNEVCTAIQRYIDTH